MRPPPSHKIRGKAFPVVHRPGQASPGCKVRAYTHHNQSQSRAALQKQGGQWSRPEINPQRPDDHRIILFDAGALYSDRARADERRRRRAVSRARRCRRAFCIVNNVRRMQLGHRRWFGRTTKRDAACSPPAARRGKIRGEFVFSEGEPYSRSRYRGVPMGSERSSLLFQPVACCVLR